MYNYSIHGQDSQWQWHCQGQRKYYVNMPYRSHDSLSLMHHVNAAGSRPVSVARSPVPAPSMHTSSAVVRQPLTKLDTNQQQQQQQQQPQQTESAASPSAGGQADAGPVSMSTEQHQCRQQQQQQTQEWEMQTEDAEVTHSHGPRDAAGTATARRLDQDLQLMQESFQHEGNLQSNQQTADRQHQLPVEAMKVLKDSQEPRHVKCASHYHAISAHSDSIHAEESHNLADMLESSSRCKTDIQMSTAASSIAGRREDRVASGGSQTKTGSSAVESVQHAWRHHGLDSSRNADKHAAQYNQQWQQQQQQQQNDWQVDLPAGIPLTPVLCQQAQPRDSLEASIWKLSSSKGKHQISPKNAFGLQQQNMPPKGASMYVLQPNRQNPNTRDKPLHIVRDSLEATLQKLAARQ